MPCWTSGDPSTKGRALIAAIKAERLHRTCDAYFAFVTGFLAGCSFVCWLLLA